jgi:peptide/nickel transport system permease protein
VVGVAAILGVTMIAIWPPLVTPYDPYFIGAAASLQPPSLAHPFGTDELGRDLLSRAAYGTRVSLASALAVVFVAMTIGAAVGLASASLFGVWDDVIMRVADIFLAFPALVMAIVLVGVMGPGLQNALIAITLIWWPQYARLVRGTSLSLLQRGFVEAARATGVTSLSIMRRHVLPNALSPILVKATIDLSLVVLLTGSLSFLGLGAQSPSPELGALLNAGRPYLLGAWWYASLPGAIIFVIALAFNLAGDGIREALDPTAQ